MIYIEWPSTDPYFNLALEQHIFDSLDHNESYFYLWQNDNAVIVGKNQNTIEEINLPFLEQNNTVVARRLSGGGAVYHDLGNLNFTFITDAKHSNRIDFEVFCAPVARAMKRVGIDAEVNGRNDITINGKKFSGNSQYLRKNRVMHHGTIMFRCDLDMISQSLKVPEDKIQSKGIKSVRSRVTNIHEHIESNLTLDEFKSILKDEILGTDYITHTLTANDLIEISRLRESKYATWEWNFGTSPLYSIRKKIRIDGCGEIEVCMNVEHGMITEMRFYGDYFEVNDSKDLAKVFIGAQARKEDFAKRLRDVNVGDYIKNLDAFSILEILV